MLVVSHDRCFVEKVASRVLMIDAGLLQEVQDPEAFYRHSLEPASGTRASSEQPQGREDRHLSPDAEHDADRILGRILYLEKALAQNRSSVTVDRARSWQEEINQLYERLARC